MKALRALATGFLFAGAAACSAPGGPSSESNWNWGPDGGSASGSDASLPITRPSALTCTPAQGSQALPARAEAMSTQVDSNKPATFFTEDLFNAFKSNCGGCHVESSLGNFHVSSQNFTTTVDKTVLDIIQSNDPAKYMPPAGAGGMPFSNRSPTDPIVQLVGLLQQWIAQGRPDELFTIDTGAAQPTTASYMLSPQVGMGMTNIGDCVPAGTIGSSTSTMDQLDAFFASATELPDTLDQTDFTTMDGVALAQMGVIAYAPQYPLWSDDSGKLRFIRVPRGQSVKFDKTAQTFTIPPNTRFYKTFLRHVIDTNGNDSWRKIETRLIVARPDTTAPDGTVQQNALFGTYVWSQDETSASLLKLPLRDGEPFTDSLIEYTIDEPKEEMIRASNPGNLKYQLEQGNPGLKRHYAIPGSQRCIQCHMGSPTQDFALGFVPLQLARRPSGTAGAYEATGADELTQVQRFIDYGILTGITSPDDIKPLEAAEGTRTARNAYELNAQAYMLGNCAHCHNPRGYPSTKSPVLKDALNFLPGPNGGIYQFPLDRFSPLRKRGLNQDVDIPYITPSLREYPVTDPPPGTWTPKWATCTPSNVASDSAAAFLCNGRMDSKPAHLAAPWRSLVYRNTDTPFMYADDFTIYPHMPMNSAGFDCRAPRIMGEWMTSIPATRKNPELDEDAIPGGSAPVDSNPQPYVEVLPADPNYPQAQLDAQARLDQYHAGRYEFCVDTSDIVDPAVIQAGGNYPIVPAADQVYDPKKPGVLLQPNTGVPIRAHWVVTDLTDPPGDWYPRRPDWQQFVVQDKPDLTALPTDPDQMATELQQRQDVVDQLQTATLSSELKKFALTDVPFGLWQQNAGCNFSAIPKVSDVAAADRPRWMNQVVPPPDPAAPVYMQSPGSSIFNNICFNCHGPKADSQGLLAEAIMNMTGGTARVADFRDGLFGPVTSPGSNRANVFGAVSNGTASVDDWASRYMAWMALGGTQAKIPIDILNIVATTRILGVPRGHLDVTGSPNMLKLGQQLCAQVIPATPDILASLDDTYFKHGTLDWTKLTALIDSNYDAEMWQRLCSLNNRVIVRVPLVPIWDATIGVSSWPRLDARSSLYWGSRTENPYPSTAPVMDSHGQVTNGIQSDNVFPVCMPMPTDPQQKAIADQFLASHPVGGAGGGTIPYCPDAWLKDPKNVLGSVYDSAMGHYTYPDANAWAVRGAINAGMSVFLYLDQLVRGKVAPPVQYNHCEQLAPAN